MILHTREQWGMSSNDGGPALALRLAHYAHKPIGAVEDRDQIESDGRSCTFKPRGLWLSSEGEGEDWMGWREWCEAESFHTGWTHIYDVTLADDANVLHIDSVGGLDAFTERYRVDDGPSYLRDGYAIRWAEVAREYDGIIISPYQWERRLDDGARWYYGWDCASGCIWRARAINEMAARSSGEVEK